MSWISRHSESLRSRTAAGFVLTGYPEQMNLPAVLSPCSLQSLHSFCVLSSQAFRLILFGQKQGRRRAVCLSDNPQFVTRVRSIAAQEPESVLNAVVVFVLVLVGQIAPVAGDMPGKEITRILTSLLERG